MSFSFAPSLPLSLPLSQTKTPENSKTINNDIESLDSTGAINDENDSINSLEMSGDEAAEKRERPDEDKNRKEELIEQLSQRMIKEQNNADQTVPMAAAAAAAADEERRHLNNSETELLTVSDSGIGDSAANLSSIAHQLPTSQHVTNAKEAAISAAALATNTITSTVLGAGPAARSIAHRQLAKLDSYPLAKTKVSTPPQRDSPGGHGTGSVKEFSFSQTTRPDKQNESGAVDRPLHELQDSSKTIAKHGSRKGRNGSGKERRMKSAGVQTTPSLRRSTPQPRPAQNKESTFSSVYTEIASKLEPTDQDELAVSMQPIEEENL